MSCKRVEVHNNRTKPVLSRMICTFLHNLHFLQNSDTMRRFLQDFLRFGNVPGPFAAHQQGTGAGSGDPRFADL